jgi:hypothetical protein
VLPRIAVALTVGLTVFAVSVVLGDGRSSLEGVLLAFASGVFGGLVAAAIHRLTRRRANAAS